MGCPHTLRWSILPNHTIPTLPYHTYTVVQVREYCGLPTINSFAELNNTVEEETISLLESVYGHHQDIDLVVSTVMFIIVTIANINTSFNI